MEAKDEWHCPKRPYCNETYYLNKTRCPTHRCWYRFRLQPGRRSSLLRPLLCLAANEEPEQGEGAWSTSSLSEVLLRLVCSAQYCISATFSFQLKKNDMFLQWTCPLHVYAFFRSLQSLGPADLLGFPTATVDLSALCLSPLVLIT